MCRLFGLHAGRNPVTATLWLLNAPDSLAEQSHRNPDGTGIGLFGADGQPVVDKQPIAAWEDQEFSTEAKTLHGTTFVAHVRYASTGGLTDVNTHPFLADGRIFAHNGVVGGLEILDARLGDLGVDDLVKGQTDSERVFALITATIRGAGGDVEAGLTEALSWLAASVPIFSVNLLLTTATDLWAVRYPESHPLYLLDRREPDTRPADLATSRIRTRSEHLAQHPSVVFATEPMDDDPAWQPMRSGELVHVDADLAIHRRVIIDGPPTHPLTLGDLSGHAAASQQPTRAA